MSEVLKTYKFYDVKGRRLSIFGVENATGDKLIITYFPCSKDEQFSKKDANEAYETGIITRYKKKTVGYDEKTKPIKTLVPTQVIVNKTVLEVPLVDNKPKFTFMEFCKDTFLSKGTGSATIEYEYEYLYSKKRTPVED